MLELLIYLAVGAFAGTLAGLFGVGGGLVIVPVLAWVFEAADMAPAVLMHVAIGSSLGTIVFTSLASIRAHHRRGAVRWRTFARLAPGIVVGAWLGAWVAASLPGSGLQRIFGLFELVVAVQMAIGWQPAPHRGLPGGGGLTAAGAGIGGVSAVVGIGGGTLTVPFLSWCNVPMRQAVATSAAAGLPIALAGALGYAVTGWGESGLPAWSTGYLYWPAVAGVVAASMVFAPMGARLAHTLPTGWLRRLFALFLAAVGIYMLM